MSTSFLLGDLGSENPKKLPNQYLILGFIFAGALLSRLVFLGDPNYYVDENYYLLVGQRMLQGDLLYVDIWDRKGPALFILFSGIAWISNSIISVQIFAIFFVFLTAVIVYRCALYFSSPIGALGSAFALMALYTTFGGASGQAPVFYNAFVCAAALLVFRSLEVLKQGKPDKRLDLAMLLLGMAICFKLTSVFDGIYFGLLAVVLLARSGAPNSKTILYIMRWAAIGVAPIAAAAIVYMLWGEIDSFIHAVFMSGFERSYETDDRSGALRLLAAFAAPGLAAAIAGFLYGWKAGNDRIRIAAVAGWLGITVVPVLTYPATDFHYLLPSVPPLVLLCAPLFGRAGIGLIAAAGVIAMGLLSGQAVDRQSRKVSMSEMQKMADYIVAEGAQNDVVVLADTLALYRMTKSQPRSPLAFPQHLLDEGEYLALRIDPAAEIERIFESRPSAIVVPLTTHFRNHNKRVYSTLTSELKKCANKRDFTPRTIYSNQRVRVYSKCSLPN